jgi:hypothetical protein
MGDQQRTGRRKKGSGNGAALKTPDKQGISKPPQLT